VEIVLVIIAFILLIAGILGAVVPILPGPPLSFIGLLLLQWSGFAGFSSSFLWLFGCITIAVTVMDYLLPSLMARWFGGSRAAAIGSFIGLLVGLFFFPPFGMIVGSFIGAMMGEFIHNGAKGLKAFKVAFGAFLAFIAGAGAKLITSSVMLYYAVIAMF
jgi:uncharacterized protein YqgC (DUF456 family)